MLLAALFIIAKIWKQSKCSSTNEWTKMWYIYVCVYTHTHTHTLEYYSAIEKNEILLFAATWIGLEGITLS